MLAPELLRVAIDVGIAVGWEAGGMVFAQVTNRRSRRQCSVFDEMKANPHTPDVLLGTYYAGNFRRMQ